MCVAALQVERLNGELRSLRTAALQKGSEETQEAQRRSKELEAELLKSQVQLSECQERTQDAQERVGTVRFTPASQSRCPHESQPEGIMKMDHEMSAFPVKFKIIFGI